MIPTYEFKLDQVVKEWQKDISSENLMFAR